MVKLHNVILKYILASIPVIAALSWNDVMKHVFYKVIPVKESLKTKLWYSLFLTLLVVFLYFVLIPQAPFLDEKYKALCKKIMNGSAPVNLDDDDE